MVPAILRNDDAEALILDIRAGRNAARQDVADQAGAFLLFPTSVVVPGPSRGQSVYPLRGDAEPGALVTSSGQAQVTGRVAGITVTGGFHWALGEDPAPPAAYHFQRRGRPVPVPPWASQLPGSQQLSYAASTRLVRQQTRLQRQGRGAEHCLLRLTERVIRQFCCGPIHRAIQFRPLIDVDDVVQRGLQVACRLLPLYASPERPPCSWLGAIRLDGRRDMHREVSRLDWLPPDVAAAATLAHACGVVHRPDPSATLADLVEAADRLGRTVPRIAAGPLDAALRAPTYLQQEAVAGAAVPGPESSLVEAFGHQQGRQVVTTVARLVSDDTEFIASVADEDPRALGRVGDRVVRRLSGDCESRAAARRRCWQEFQDTGELFTTAAGLHRFGSIMDPDSLAAIDDCLRRAAGDRGAAGDGRGAEDDRGRPDDWGTAGDRGAEDGRGAPGDRGAAGDR